MAITDSDRLSKDLKVFSDPATDFDVKSGSSGIRVQMVRNGEHHEYFLNHSDNSITARHAKNRRFVNLRSLLASPDFSDTRGLAATQVRMHRDFQPDALLAPEGEIDGRKLALQTLQRSTNPVSPSQDGSKISIVLLDGPAGVGKTSLIERLVVQRARTQTENASAPPILHVTNRGRRLSALDDALAQSLQLLRAQFTFDQVPVLVRHNLLQLAIDGFDELVDPEGYKDAWFALRDFFDSLEFGGPVILAGRDTFFDQQSFSKQMSQANHQFDLTHVRLGSVSPAAAKQWLAAKGWAAKELADPYTDIVLRPGSYALRPYFLTELAKAKGWKAIKSVDLTPRAYLVDQFVTRESTLLGEKLSISAADVGNKLTSVFEEAAIEMADTETDSVDLSFLQMATEIAFGDSLSQIDVAKLRHKAGSFALLERDSRDGFRRFPHTEISHHFLAQGLVRLISAGSRTRFLRRGIATPDLLAILAELLMSKTESDVRKFVSELELTLEQESSFDRLADNVASILFTTLSCELPGPPRRYTGLQIPNAAVFGEAAPAQLQGVRIQRLVAEEATFTKVEFTDCEIINLFADETTRFGLTLPTVHRLHHKTDRGVVKDIFKPEEIEKWLLAHSERPSKKRVNEAAIQLLDRVCRTMMRQHMIKDHDDDPAGRYLRDPLWPEIEKILTEKGWIDRLHNRQMAGSRAPFVRMRDPYRLLAHRNAADTAPIWEKIASIEG